MIADRFAIIFYIPVLSLSSGLTDIGYPRQYSALARVLLFLLERIDFVPGPAVTYVAPFLQKDGWVDALRKHCRFPLLRHFTLLASLFCP